MRTRVLVASTFVGLASSFLALTPALAQSDAGAGRYVAANCANCHGTNGVAKGAMPSLAGQKKDYLARRLRGE